LTILAIANVAAFILSTCQIFLGDFRQLLVVDQF